MGAYNVRSAQRTAIVRILARDYAPNRPRVELVQRRRSRAAVRAQNIRERITTTQHNRRAFMLLLSSARANIIYLIPPIITILNMLTNLCCERN